jgi:hypothetical protein
LAFRTPSSEDDAIRGTEFWFAFKLLLIEASALLEPGRKWSTFEGCGFDAVREMLLLVDELALKALLLVEMLLLLVEADSGSVMRAFEGVR